MSLVKWGFIGILALPAAELLAFVLVALLIGWLWAAILFIGTSVIGVMLLRRSGRGNLERLRTALARDGLRAVHLETPGAAAMLGGVLLIFPGFITDVLGASLLIPAVRRWVAAKFRTARKRRRQSRGDPVIDLDPGEWRQLPDQRRRRPAKAERRKDTGGRE